jgi:hypothetical protein
MTSQEKDKFIVEWFGECWHEWIDIEDDWPECS